MIHVDEPVLPWPVLEARPLRPVVAGLLPEDLLKLGLRLLRAGERRVLELAGVVADPAPVGEQDPDVLVLLLPDLGADSMGKVSAGHFAFHFDSVKCVN